MKLYSMLTRHKAILLIVIFLFSLIIRCGWTYLDHSTNGIKNWVDAKLYLRHGLDFAKGDFYPEYMPEGPVIPLIVALSEVTTGDPIWPVLFLNCLLSSMAVLILFWLGQRLANPYVGFILALWFVFHHVAMKYNFQILKEPLLFLLMPLSIMFLINIYDREKTYLYLVLSALVFSIMIHTDERFLVYAPIFFLFIMLCRKWQKGIMQAVLWLAIVIATMIPWTIRNYNQYGEIILLTPRTTAFTSKLWGTDYAQLFFNTEEVSKRLTEARKEEAYQAARKYGIQPRPYGKHEKYIKAFIHYWQPTHFRLTFIQDGFRPVKSSLLSNLNGIFFYGMFLPFYCAGLLLALIKKNKLVLFLATLPLIHSVIHTIMIWPLGRYRLIMDFLVILVALWLINGFFVKRSETRQ